MRKIGMTEIFVFVTLFMTAVALAILTTELTVGSLYLSDFRGVTMIVAALSFTYIYAFAIHRLFLYFMPLREGEITNGSREEFAYHVYLLFNLILFYPLMRNGAIPVPLMRLIYLALGARLGDNTYSAGLMLDPSLIEIGANTIIGERALLVPHVIEGDRLAHYRINIGNNVTIGAHAVVLSGASVGDNAIVATGAVVTKGSRIGPNEIWGGVPARRLGMRAPHIRDATLG